MLFSSLPPVKLFMLLCHLLIFFKIDIYEKKNSRVPSECKTIWIQIWLDVLSVLILVQSVCKSYQQTILGGKELTLRPPFTSLSFVPLLCLSFYVAYIANSMGSDHEQFCLIGVHIVCLYEGI